MFSLFIIQHDFGGSHTEHQWSCSENPQVSIMTSNNSNFKINTLKNRILVGDFSSSPPPRPLFSSL